jgi:hypothetical protein
MKILFIIAKSRMIKRWRRPIRMVWIIKSRSRRVISGRRGTPTSKNISNATVSYQTHGHDKENNDAMVVLLTENIQDVLNIDD